MSDWRLPRMTPDLVGDWRVAMRAYEDAVADEQRRAVALRCDMLAERQRAIMRPAFETMAAAWADLCRDIARSMATWQQHIRASTERPAPVQVRRRGLPSAAAIVDEVAQFDPIARARARRGSGPAAPRLDGRRR